MREITRTADPEYVPLIFVSRGVDVRYRTLKVADNASRTSETASLLVVTRAAVTTPSTFTLA
jgi:hypothetical protein